MNAHFRRLERRVAYRNMMLRHGRSLPFDLAFDLFSLWQILRMGFIKKHIHNFLADVVSRETHKIGEGTMVLKAAAVNLLADDKVCATKLLNAWDTLAGRRWGTPRVTAVLSMRTMFSSQRKT